jgi:hypothetical protein
MKLKIGNIGLLDWHTNNAVHPYTVWARDFGYSDTSDLLTSTAVYIATYHVNPYRCFVHFYYTLDFLQHMFTEDLGDDLEVAKKQVDNFLIRMNKLAVFL